MAARSKSAPRLGPGGGPARPKRALEQVLEADSSPPLRAPALQRFGSDEGRLSVTDYFPRDVALFESLARAGAAAGGPSEAGPAKATPRAEARPAPGCLRARRAFFKRLLEDEKNDGQDLSCESLRAGLALGELAASGGQGSDRERDFSARCKAQGPCCGLQERRRARPAPAPLSQARGQLARAQARGCGSGESSRRGRRA